MNKWLIIFAILLTACTGTSEKSEECITIDLATVFDHQPQEVALKKWAKSIQFIPLQTNDSILIKYISRIIKHGDKLLVQHDNRASVFDLAGKYLYDIGKQGGGPDEFSRISGLEPHDHLIYIKDSPIRIKVYDWQGKFHQTIQIPDKNIRGFYPLPKTNVILGHVPNLSGNAPIRFYFCQDTVISDSIPYYKSYTEPPFVMTFTYEFRPFDGNKIAAFKELFCDTIFKVSNDMKLTPYAVLDLGKYRTPEELRYNITIDDIKNDLFRTKTIPVIPGQIGDRLYMHNFSDKDTYTLYYDIAEKQLAYVQFIYPENSFELPEEGIAGMPQAYFTPKYISNDNRYLIDWEQPENDNNPVLILVEP